MKVFLIALAVACGSLGALMGGAWFYPCMGFALLLALITLAIFGIEFYDDINRPG